MTLDQLTHVDPGHGFAEVGAGAATGVTPYVYAMAGWRLSNSLSAFGQAEADSMTGYQATAGLRWTF